MPQTHLQIGIECIFNISMYVPDIFLDTWAKQVGEGTESAIRGHLLFENST